MPEGHHHFLRAHKTSRLANLLYQSSLIFLVVLISIVLLASGYDVAQQVVIASRGRIRFSDTSITAGGYLLVAIGSVVIVFSRLFTVKRELASIPKGYLPLGKDDLDKNLYRLVTSEYARCAMIAHASNPKRRTLPGWGAPGTDFAGMHFRTEILETLKTFDSFMVSERVEELMDKSMDASNPSSLHKGSRFTSPLARWKPVLTGHRAVIPQAYSPIVSVYEKRLEDARWKADEPSQEDYEECVRALAVIMSAVTEQKKQKT